MNQKQIGIVIAIISVVLIGVFYYIKVEQDNIAMQYTMLNNGSCVTEDGVCLHQRASSTFILGLAVSIFLLALSAYLIFFDKTQQVLAVHQREVSSALKEAKRSDKFEAFLAGFNDDEKKVLKAIKEQDGIQQSTLTYRAGISKAALSVMLKGFEEKGIVFRKLNGKSNKVFMKKAY